MNDANHVRWVGGVLTIIVLVASLMPWPTTYAYFQQSTTLPLPDFNPAQPPDSVVRLNPNRSLVQRVWVPAGARITGLRLLPASNTLPVPSVTLQVNALAVPGIVTHHPEHPHLQFIFPQPLAAHEEWVDMVVHNSGPAPLFLLREIDSAAYPGGQLTLRAVASEHPLLGVLAFELWSWQLRWAPLTPRIVMLLLLIGGWTYISTRRKNEPSTRARLLPK